MLLEFRVSKFRSFRDEAALSLVNVLTGRETARQ
jgi:AAA15 family ATPase/GTPase